MGHAWCYRGWLILYVPVNNISVMLGRTLPGLDQFSQVEKFTELASKLCRSEYQPGKKSPAITVLQELAKIKQIQVPDIQELYGAIKEACFAYKKPECTPTSRKIEPMVSNCNQKQWYKQKHDLKAAIQVHLQVIAKIQKVEVICWKSRDKVKKYSTMIKAAESAIKNYKDNRKEFDARTESIAILKNISTEKQKIHIKNIRDYENLIAKEDEICKKMKEIASSLRTEITTCIRRKLQSGFADLKTASCPTNCTMTPDLDGISERIYGLTCKQYKFEAPQADPTYATYKEDIFKPNIYKQEKSFVDTTHTYGCNKSLVTNTNNSDYKAEEALSLALKKGDKVKLQCVSNSGSRGFGWMKHSSLSTKKWGFFKMCDMIPKHPRECCSQVVE